MASTLSEFRVVRTGRATGGHTGRKALTPREPFPLPSFRTGISGAVSILILLSASLWIALPSAASGETILDRGTLPSDTSGDPITDLGTLPGDEYSAAVRLNEAGQVVGWSGTDYSYRTVHGFVWQNGVMTDLGNFGSNPVSTQAADINEAGQVVGWSLNASGYIRAFLWENGVMTDLNVGTNSNAATAINDAGQVAGWHQVPTGDPNYPNAEQAFLWQDGETTNLGGLPGRVHSIATAINNAGQVVGWSDNYDRGTQRAFLWQDGVMTDIGSLPGDAESVAYDISDTGEIVGWSGGSYSEMSHAFLWVNGTMTPLAEMGYVDSIAWGINNQGQVVGFNRSLGTEAVVWQNGSYTVLGGFPPSFTSSAYDINDAGLSVGTSSPNGTYGGLHAVLWANPVAIHDVGVTATAQPMDVTQGTPVWVTVQATNGGNREETFNVTASLGTNLVGSSTVTVSPRGVKLAAWSWDTSTVEPGPYNLTATASPVSGETNLADNSYTSDIPLVVYAPLAALTSISPSSTDVGIPISFTCWERDRVAPYGPYTFFWDFGDGQNATAPTATHTYETAGTMTATCSLTDSGGTTANSATVLLIYPAPIVTASANRSEAKPDEPFAFEATTTGGSGGFVYNWGFGDGTSAEGAQVTHAYAAVGQYTAIVTVRDSAGRTAANTVTVTVSHGVVPLSAHSSAVPSATDVGLAITFTCAGSDGTPPYQYAWAFGDDSTGSGATVSHVYTSDGTRTVTCTVTDDTGATSTSQTTVQVYPVPTVTATVERTSASPGTNLNFTASATGGSGIFTYGWGFGDGSSATGPTVTHAYEKPGQYAVVVTVQDSVGAAAPNSVGITVTVSYLAGTAIQSTTETVAGDPITLSAVASGGSGEPYSFTWEFGDGQSDTGRTVTHAYLDPGSYTPKVTITDAMGTSQTRTLGTITVRNSSPATSSSGAWPGYMNVAIGGIVVVAVLGVIAMLVLRRRPPKT